jgi:two-component sensor histidine kinase
MRAKALTDARWQTLAAMEELAQISSLLREAINDTTEGNLAGGMMVATDTLEVFAEMEERLSEMAASVAKWVESASAEILQVEVKP